MSISLITLILKVVCVVPPLLVAVILHEIAHGWVAFKLGDPTAKSLGRITINPIKHVDFTLTILLPGILILSGSPFIFGGAKPVPVNPYNFKNPRRGMAYVALAGPVVNFILAAIFLICCMIYLSILPVFEVFISPWILFVLANWITLSFLINIILGLFNLLPIPPLDGGRIAVGFLPLSIAKRWAKLENFGLLIVLGLLFSGLLDKLLLPAIMLAEQVMKSVGFGL